jgi:hypothetical protein
MIKPIIKTFKPMITIFTMEKENTAYDPLLCQALGNFLKQKVSNSKEDYIFM